VLGEVGRGYKYAIETLNEGRIGIGAQMLGVAEAALHAATGYARERVQFGKPVAEFQGHAAPAGRLRHADRGGAPFGLERGAAPGRRPPLRARGGHGQARVQRRRGIRDLLGGGDLRRERYTTEYPWRSSTATPRSGRSTRAPPFMQKATIAKMLLAGD
jgi:hypothetical protein